jgi:hypothetical protein
LDPVERFIAPHDFHEQLAGLLGDRLKLGSTVTGIESAHMLINCQPVYRASYSNAISTIPLKVLQSEAGIGNTHEFYIPPTDFKSKAITTLTLELEGVDAHQTIYFPDMRLGVYRASIVGSRMIVEVTDHGWVPSCHHNMLVDVYRAFGLDVPAEFEFSANEQKLGKILPISDDSKRRNAILQMTQRFGIYSLGRFACWRNTIMDDVYEDILNIRSMMERDSYHHNLKG